MKPRKLRSELGWNQCKEVLKSWPQRGVVALVQELYRLSDENRRFLHGRLLPQRAAMNLDATAKVLRRMLSVSAVFNNEFRHIKAKRVVDQFEKSAGDPAAVAELLLIDLATTLETFSQVGDCEPLVDHAYATMRRLEKRLVALDASQAQPLVETLSQISDRWSGQFGYGLSDELEGMAAEFVSRFQKSQESRDCPRFVSCPNCGKSPFQGRCGFTSARNNPWTTRGRSDRSSMSVHVNW